MTREWTFTVLDPARSEVGEIDTWAKVEIVKRWAGVSTWRLIADESDTLTALREPGAALRVLVDGDEWLTGPVRSMVRTADIDATTFDVGGWCDLVWLGRRLAHPAPADTAPSGAGKWSAAYKTRSGVASTVIRAYVDENAGPSAVSFRQVPGLTLAADPAVGSTVSESARFDPLLELAQRVAATDELGLDATGLVFTVAAPTDSTGTIVFSLADGTADKWAETRTAPGATHAYVAGSGDGADRVFVVAGDEAAAAAWGRVEVFRDRRDSADLTGVLTTTGAALLAELAATDIATVSPVDTDGQAWRTHWDLGHRVSLALDGTVATALVAEVAVTLTADDEAVVPKVGTIRLPSAPLLDRRK